MFKLRVVDLRTIEASAHELSAAELRRSASFAKEVDRERFVRRRNAIRAIAMAHCGNAPSWKCGVCGSDDHGAPSLHGASISSSSYGSALVVVIGPAQWQLGVDVAPRSAPRDMMLVVQQLFSPAERTLDDAMGVWVRKEALGKALGLGIACDDAAHASGRLDTTTTDFILEDHDVDMFDELRAAVARRSVLLR